MMQHITMYIMFTFQAISLKKREIMVILRRADLLDAICKGDNTRAISVKRDVLWSIDLRDVFKLRLQIS